MSATARTDNHGLVRPWERNRSFVLESRSPSPSLALWPRQRPYQAPDFS